MALEDGGNGGGMVMPVSPMIGNGGFGNTGFGNDGWWIILLFILLGNNGWGNGYGGAGGATTVIDGSVQRGFDQAAVMGSLGDIQGAICSGFANAETAATARQMADMQQTFALQSQFAECCCENRLATADLKYTIATENCADRYEAAQNTRDILENCNRNNQAILDKICQLELDAKNDRISELERQLQMATLSASQTAQTAYLVQNNEMQTTYLTNRLIPTPIPAYIVANPNAPATTSATA